MPNTTTSPNMMLTIPVVGVDPGPDYASNINLCLNTIDGHTHASGSGVQITPAGLSISSDLSFIVNNATNLRSARFTSQSSTLALPSDMECIYVAGVDLYYNDGSGNTIRLTQSGSVAGASGSITGLASPASATYVTASSTFIWQSGVNIAANLDARNIILRNSTASSKGLTLSPPASMAADYTITLPALPGSQSFVTIDASGAFAAPITYSLGITASNIANGTITYQKLAAGAIQTNSTSFTTSGSWVVPGAIKNATFVLCGGGAGGGGGAGTDGVGGNGGGGGGGSGSVAYERTISTIPGETLTITVGAGGGGGGGGTTPSGNGSPGSDGETSLVQRSSTTLFKVGGGFGGRGGTSGGAGGAAGTGGFQGPVLATSGGNGGASTNVAGGAGNDSFYANGGTAGPGSNGGGGGGGGGGLGNGGSGAASPTGAGSNAGATSFGAGGGGGSGGGSAGGGTGGGGGSGASGVVIIYWTGDAS